MKPALVFFFAVSLYMIVDKQLSCITLGRHLFWFTHTSREVGNLEPLGTGWESTTQIQFNFCFKVRELMINLNILVLRFLKRFVIFDVKVKLFPRR